MKTLSLAILSTAILISACADPAANKPKAQVTAPANNATTNTAPASNAEPAKADVLSGFKAAGTEFAVTSETSKIEFTGSKVTGKHDGGFKKFTGVIDFVGGKAETSKVLIEIDMTSVFSDADGLTKHLQTGDFFDVAKFPKASFVSTSISAPPGGTGNYTIAGDMTIRGVKKSITFPASITASADSVAVTAEFSINRKDFGIVYAGKADDLIRDDVVLKLDLKAAKKK